MQRVMKVNQREREARVDRVAERAVFFVKATIRSTRIISKDYDVAGSEVENTMGWI